MGELFELGDGCSSITGERKLSAIDNIALVKPKKNKKYSYLLTSVKSSSQLKKYLGASLGLTLNVNGIGAGANAGFEGELQYNEGDWLYILVVKQSEYSHRWPVDYHPKSTKTIGGMLKASPENFYINYGDKYIRQINYGRSLVAVIRARDAQNKQSLTGSLGGNINAIVPTGEVNVKAEGKGEVKAGLERLKSLDIININVKAAGLEVPGNPSTIDDLKGFIDKFKDLAKDVEPVAQSYETSFYETVEGLNPAAQCLKIKTQKAAKFLKRINESWDLCNAMHKSLNFTMHGYLEHPFAKETPLQKAGEQYKKELGEILLNLKKQAKSIAANPFRDLSAIESKLERIEVRLEKYRKDLPFVASKHFLTSVPLTKGYLVDYCKINLKPKELPPNTQYLYYEITPVDSVSKQPVLNEFKIKIKQKQKNATVKLHSYKGKYCKQHYHDWINQDDLQSILDIQLSKLGDGTDYKINVYAARNVKYPESELSFIGNEDKVLGDSATDENEDDVANVLLDSNKKKSSEGRLSPFDNSILGDSKNEAKKEAKARYKKGSLTKNRAAFYLSQELKQNKSSQRQKHIDQKKTHGDGKVAPSVG